MEFHWYEAAEAEPGTDPALVWCKHCNCTMTEHLKMWPYSDRGWLHDYVAAHGFGEPTEAGYELAKELLATGDDYAEAAAEVAFRGLTTGGDEC